MSDNQVDDLLGLDDDAYRAASKGGSPVLRVREDSLFDEPDVPLLNPDPEVDDEERNCDGHEEERNPMLWKEHCHTVIRRDGDKKAVRQLVAVSGVCTVFMIAEIIGGILAGSLAIATDATHLASDLAGFLISLFAIWLSRRPPTIRMSFGYFRAEVLGALVSIMIIWVVTGILVYLAIDRIVQNKYDIEADAMMITSGAGVLFNIVMGLVLHGAGCHVHSSFGHSHGHSHDGHGHSHGGHGHSHGGHGHSHGDHSHDDLFNGDQSHGGHGHSRSDHSGHLHDDHSHDGHGHSHGGHGHSHDGPCNGGHSTSGHSHSDHSHGHFDSGHSHGDHLHGDTHTDDHTTAARSTAVPVQNGCVHSHPISQSTAYPPRTSSSVSVVIATCPPLYDHTTTRSADPASWNNVSSDDSMTDLLLTSSTAGDVEHVPLPRLHRQGRRQGTGGCEGTTVGGVSFEADHTPVNLNIRAAMIHVIGDLIQSIGVFIAAVIIKIKKDWKIADPICTFVFSVLVLFTTANVLRDIAVILMQGVPRKLNYKSVKEDLEKLNGVKMVHSLNIWSLTMDKFALSVHLAIGNDATVQGQDLLQNATTLLRTKYNINHTTIQVERYNELTMPVCPSCQYP